MTANAREKKAARALAAERGIRYADALRELRATQDTDQSRPHEPADDQCGDHVHEARSLITGAILSGL